MREEVAAQVRHHALADGHDEVIANARGEGENRHHDDEAREIGVQQARLRLRKPVVDHAANGHGHHEGRARSHHQGPERGQDAAAAGVGVGQQGPQGAQRDAAPLWVDAGGIGHREADSIWIGLAVT